MSFLNSYKWACSWNGLKEKTQKVPAVDPDTEEEVEVEASKKTCVSWIGLHYDKSPRGIVSIHNHQFNVEVGDRVQVFDLADGEPNGVLAVPGNYVVRHPLAVFYSKEEITTKVRIAKLL